MYLRKQKICKAKLPIISKTIINIAGLEIEFHRKKVKNINLRITKDGKIIASASQRVNLEDVKKFVTLKQNWLKEKQIEIKQKNKNRNSSDLLDEKQFIFLGKKYSLQLIESNSCKVELLENIANLYCKIDSSKEQKLAIIEKFYRQELQKLIPSFITNYTNLTNLKITGFAIKKMKTRWGSCNIKNKFIWISLEIAKKPLISLESLIVHEITHLIERKHNKRFYQLMTHFMPNWREGEKFLKT